MHNHAPNRKTASKAENMWRRRWKSNAIQLVFTGLVFADLPRHPETKGWSTLNSHLNILKPDRTVKHLTTEASASDFGCCILFVVNSSRHCTVACGQSELPRIHQQNSWTLSSINREHCSRSQTDGKIHLPWNTLEAALDWTVHPKVNAKTSKAVRLQSPRLCLKYLTYIRYHATPTSSTISGIFIIPAIIDFNIKSMLLANEIIVPIKLVFDDVRRDKPIVATILCEFTTGTHVYHEAIPWQCKFCAKDQRAHFFVSPDFRIKNFLCLRFNL